ncbi:MAG: hypothetical protein WDN31_12065 [Hyphomicrobium sp.]
MAAGEQPVGVLRHVEDALGHEARLARSGRELGHVAEHGEGHAGIDAGMGPARRQARQMHAERVEERHQVHGDAGIEMLARLAVAAAAVALHQRAQHVAVDGIGEVERMCRLRRFDEDAVVRIERRPHHRVVRHRKAGAKDGRSADRRAYSSRTARKRL